MTKAYDDETTRELSRFMLDEESLRAVCERLGGQRLKGDFLRAIRREWINYTIMRDMDGNVNLATITLRISVNAGEVDVCFFRDSGSGRFHTHINTSLIDIQTLQGIIRAEMREGKMEELGI